MSKSLTLVFFTIMILIPSRILSQQKEISMKINLKTGVFLNFNTYDRNEFSPAIYIAPSFRINKHEFYIGLIYPFVGISGWDGWLKQHIDLVAGYNFYLLKHHRRVNLYLHYEFQYLVYSGYVYTQSREPREYFDIDRYFNNIVGIGFIGFLNKNQGVGISWSLGYNFSKNPMWFYIDYLNANLGVTIKIASFNKKRGKQ